MVYYREKNVFGAPITPNKYAKKEDRARAAFSKISAGGKRDDCLQYVKQQKEWWGTGVSTLGMIYNATGDNLTLVSTKDWYGHIEADYPTFIQNGQWGGFLHVKNNAATSGSEAAVVYSAYGKNSERCNIMVCWDNPWNKAWYTNRVYSDIENQGYFTGKVWDKVYKLISETPNAFTARAKGLISAVDMDKYATSPVFTAILSMQGTHSIKQAIPKNPLMIEYDQNTKDEE